MQRVVTEYLKKIGRNGGKKSRRIITSEQQKKMQAARQVTRNKKIVTRMEKRI